MDQTKEPPNILPAGPLPVGTLPEAELSLPAEPKLLSPEPANLPPPFFPPVSVPKKEPVLPPPAVDLPLPPPIMAVTSPAKPKFSIKSILLILAGLALLAVAAFFIINFWNKNKLAKAPITLTYWGLFEPSSVFQQVIADFEKEHPRIKINYTQENLKMYRERLQAALERKEGPDIFRIHQSWIPMLGNLLAPIPITAYNAAAFEETFYPSAKATLNYKGQYVAVPLMVDGLALFYNEDIFKAAGKVPPKTWGELKKVACELTVKDEQGKIRTAGVALGMTANIDHWSDILGLMMLQNGADLANPAFCDKSSGEPICFGKDALTFYTIFASGQACNEEGIGVGSVWNSLMPTSTYAFATGQLAMYFGPSWRVFDIKTLNDKLNFKIIPVPQLQGGNINWASYWVEAVSLDSKHQTEAWDFLKYLSSKEVLQKLYQAESALRLYFGEPYPRVDMAELLKTQPYVGAFIEEAPLAKNWYLSSGTSDGGINSQISKYYEDAVNAVNQGQDPLQSLTTATQGVNQVLRQYGLTK